MCVVCLTVASLAAVAVSLTVSSCQKSAEKSTQTVSTINNSGDLVQMDLPNWVINPYVDLADGVIAGVGISKKPGPNDQLRFLMMQAESQARAEIATTLQTEVSRMVKDAMQSASIENINAVESSFSVVTKEIVKNVPLSGAVKDKFHQDKTGTVYIRVVINSSVVKNYLQENLSNYSEAMKKANISRDVIQKTNASLKNLFDELDLKTATKEE